MKDLKQITVVGLGLLGGSISLAVLRSFPRAKVIGYAHRSSTRALAKELAVATGVTGNLKTAAAGSDLVILATPIGVFETIFDEIADVLTDGCIVTDVGSTKVLPHRWAASVLPDRVHYVGSHPIAGSEQRGVEFARDDLFDRAICILTTTRKSNEPAVQTLSGFWSAPGCIVQSMTPAEHDRVFANVSHLAHITAVALANANVSEDLKFCGKGFMDTSRIASSPANIWADVLLTNAKNATRGIERVIAELTRLSKAIEKGNKKQIEVLLEKARVKRGALIGYKLKNKEILS
ncbi:MAG: prephenate dehydrogenase [Phycisphaerales bacterium]|nr:MAG: prephenate dehydrogenase [Phycisphaerales bacterium]